VLIDDPHRGVTRGDKGERFPGAESLWGTESLRRVPKSPNNVTSTFFNAVYLLPKDLRFDNGAPNLLLVLGAI